MVPCTDLKTRRFIMALSLAIGSGVTVWPYAFIDLRASNYTANFWRCADCSDALKGLRNGISIFLSTGYCVGTVVAMLLNMILPQDAQVIKTGDTHFDETEDVTSTGRDDGVEVPLESSKDLGLGDPAEEVAEEVETSGDLDKSGFDDASEKDDEIAV